MHKHQSFFVDIDGRKDLDELEKIKLNLILLIKLKGLSYFWLLDEPI